MRQVILAVCMAVWVASLADGASAQPVERWQVDAQPARCSLQRQIGQPPTLLMFETLPGSGHFDVAVVGSDLPRLSGTRPARLRLDNSDFEQRQPTIGTVIEGRRQLVALREIEWDRLQTLAASKAISFTQGRTTLGPFGYANAGRAVAAFQTCVDGQLTEWGADPAQFGAGGTIPKALVNRDDWVPRAVLLKMVAAGDVNSTFRVRIATDGKIDECYKLDSRTHVLVETLACNAVLGRTLFAPALDPSGVPVRGAASFRVMLVSRPAGQMPS